MRVTIQTLAQRCRIEPVVLNAFASFIPILGVYHVILDTKFLEPAVQVEAELTRFVTGHHFTGQLLLFDYESISLSQLIFCTVCRVAPSP